MVVQDADDKDRECQKKNLTENDEFKKSNQNLCVSADAREQNGAFMQQLVGRESTQHLFGVIMHR
jgi:hypothetical protein